MKWIMYLGCTVFFLLNSQLAISGIPPVTLSGPSPSISSSYNAGDSTTVTYTVTNNTPVAFPLTISGISNPLSRTTVSGDCGNTLAAGPSICNIGILIAPTSTNSGNSINQTLAVNYQGRISLTSNIIFSIPSSTVVLAAVGKDLTLTRPPLLAISNDPNGNTWTVKSITGLSVTKGSFNGVSCTGLGSTAVCVAGGLNQASPSKALLAISTNGGSSWQYDSTFSNPPNNSVYYSTSCTGSGTNIVCVAVGNDPSNTLLATSTNGTGTQWAENSVSGITGFLNSVSCIGNGTSALCVAAGAKGSPQTPYFIVSTDGGNTWVDKSIGLAGLPATGFLLSASCTGSSSNAVCVIGGKSNVSPSPALLITGTIVSGVQSWSVSSVSGAPTKGEFNAVSCTGSSSTDAICLAAGENDASPISPMFAVSVNAGQTWSRATAPGTPATGNFQGASCTGGTSAAICVASGADLSNNAILIASTNGGVSWTSKSITGDPGQTSLAQTSCTGSGSSTLCFAVGSNSGTNQAVIASSHDGANTWTLNSISSPSQGYFNGSAATGG